MPGNSAVEGVLFTSLFTDSVDNFGAQLAQFRDRGLRAYFHTDMGDTLYGITKRSFLV